MQDFRQIRVWQLAHHFAAQTIRALNAAPRGNAALRLQLTRSAASIAANIAEGAAQHSRAQYAHFLSVAIGSAAESHNHLLLLEAIGAITPADTRSLIGMLDVMRPQLIKLESVVRRASLTQRTHNAERTTHNTAATEHTTDN